MSSNQEHPVESLEAADAPLITDDFTKWTVDEVTSWCVSSLEIATDDPVIERMRENGVSGELLPELTFDDCKELCGEDLNKAVRLKVLLNRLQNDADRESKLEEQQQHMVVTLRNLYSTVSQKLQEYQTQYAKLRLDVLELVKTSNVSPKIPAHETPSHAVQPSEDYFGGPHQPADYISTNFATPVPLSSMPRKSSSLSTRPPPNRSASSHLNDTPAGAISNEPLKQLRASKEDSCEKILKNAMKRHNLADHDWRQYVLVICYGDQERILELEEKPVVIFKNLKQQGLHPAIMLRRRGDFEELNMGGESATPGGRL
ncbi:hypothetical protein HG536_0B00610 [Torulaspora globosa]|uniref:Ras-associating domain-containing protein n=1 Tax=Torulaspora globosa TaxID=48254 RepID=A0A7G3ZCG4_9SACH|nr:uncharacterized protein HG536_0B00610 [Torulaspora globosa]QLL31200.1 hypothetical protein HG536_0B00610 [Torulaspora globosa]